MSDKGTHLQMLAMSYVLGQTSAEQQAEAEALHTSDSDFRALVSQIELWLAPLGNLAPEHEPPIGLLDEIMLSIDDGGTVLNTPAPRAIRKAPTASRSFPWRPMALAASFIALVSTSMHLLPSGQTMPAQDDLLAMLSNGEVNAPLVVIIYDPVSKSVVAHTAHADLPIEQVWQLWLIREGNDAPRSLGLLERNRDQAGVSLTINQNLTTGTDTLAISLEPQGGSPEPGPTGPILFTGQVKSLGG